MLSKYWLFDSIKLKTTTNTWNCADKASEVHKKHSFRA